MVSDFVITIRELQNVKNDGGAASGSDENLLQQQRDEIDVLQKVISG